MYDDSTPLSVSNNDRTHLIAFGTTYAIDPDSGGVFLPLGGKTHPGEFALVDAEDILRVGRIGWSAWSPPNAVDRKIFYAKGSVRHESMYLHRFILELKDSKLVVDHVNHNGLDNRRCNLRVGTHQENIFNRRANLNGSSPYKGVCWQENVGHWKASLRKGAEVRRIGYFESEEDAARAYDEWARQFFGEHAYLNFPNDTPQDVTEYRIASETGGAF